MVTLKSSDGVTSKVQEAVALQSQTIKHMIEQDDYSDNIIPLPYVTSKVLAEVIEYCEKHVQGTPEGDHEEELKTWDAEFVEVNQAILFGITSAENYLDIENLLDLTLQKAADTTNKKAVEEIRKTFLSNLLDLALQTVADTIKGKTVEDIRKTLNNSEAKSDLPRLWSDRA
ncbi:hypothetical protein MKX01_017433 [Papaver californicum]|nr:hypothetical protein MKX01_017433 [Papaver californicum]